MKFSADNSIWVQLSEKNSLRWPTIGSLRAPLEPFVSTLGRMPTSRELNLANRQDLRGDISKFGGIRHVADTLGIDWRDVRRVAIIPLDDLRTEIRQRYEQTGHLPQVAYLPTPLRLAE